MNNCYHLVNSEAILKLSRGVECDTVEITASPSLKQFIVLGSAFI